MNCLTVFATVFVAGLSVVYARDTSSCACLRVYKPVCGEDGQDYQNPSCATRCGQVAYRQGKCSEPCNCPFNIDQVCARRPDGTRKTYDNACQAECDFAVVVQQNACPVQAVQPIYLPDSNKSKRQQNGPCGCPFSWLPVCGLKGGKWTTFANECEAGCSRASRTKNGACGTGAPCACGRNLFPVCARKSDGEVREYDNQCLADCAEAITINTGSCGLHPDNSLPGDKKQQKRQTCVCTRQYHPVCGLTGGEWTDYSNPCLARCSGAESILDRPCLAPEHPIYPVPDFPGKNYPAQLPVFPEENYPAQLPVLPEKIYPALPEINYPAQLPVFPVDNTDPVPVSFPGILRKLLKV